MTENVQLVTGHSPSTRFRRRGLAVNAVLCALGGPGFAHCFDTWTLSVCERLTIHIAPASLRGTRLQAVKDARVMLIIGCSCVSSQSNLVGNMACGADHTKRIENFSGISAVHENVL
ncbi:hypothetical protein ElyMa_005606600 [Elysia marginata]|uniref:Uncharacterized protein n=1 Tax=Elysia marginata TaxID=1093978 RepID=A0AAV4F7F5_9GAST|nr:hypothetical protein ElyMa_005606600 [Elysia marginata]